MLVPTAERELIDFARNLVEECRVSAGTRTAYYRTLALIAETGRVDSAKSLINLLYKHLERTAAHLYSAVELKFSVGFDNPYPKQYYERAKQVGNSLRRQWTGTQVGTGTDIRFGKGVFESLKYGAALLKQWPQAEFGGKTNIYGKIVLPWQFGVYNEAETDLNRQYAMVETTSMTLTEIWRRIYNMSDADKLFARIRSHARKGADMNNGFDTSAHWVLSANQIQTPIDGGGSVLPGGMVSINGAPNYAMMGPQVAAETAVVHELWVQDDKDYTTILMVDPDIVISPMHKKVNSLGVRGLHPYTLIQANEVTNWIWGRSELVDLVEPQQLLSTWAEDGRRLFGLQVDKILAFVGETGITDELYGQFRNAGYINLPQGADVKDLTPKFPPELMAMLKFVIDTINTLSGFPEIMRGQGEPGVRAGVHAGTLLKTASPTLRDRALLVEQQCAQAANITLKLREAKDPTTYWTNGETEESRQQTAFRFADMPADTAVEVDSHSSSPIFSDENMQLIFAAHAKGMVQTDYVLDNLPFPNKEAAKVENKEAAEKQAVSFQQMMSSATPEMKEKVMLKQITGGKG